jgi:type II secretory pathway predicted ATPase ExeA
LAGILLKTLLAECGISQAELGRAIKKPDVRENNRSDHYGRAIISRICNGHADAWPKLDPGFREKVEGVLYAKPKVRKYLSLRGLHIADIWRETGTGRTKVKGTGRKIWETRKGVTIRPGNPDMIEINKEVEMLTQEALKHFKLFRSPFLNDVRDVEDIYLSEDHRYIEAAMLDAAKHTGFLAVIGEVGSGKSVIRKKVVAELQKDESARIIFPRMIDKTRVTAASICDAIILDLSDERPKSRLEQKARQVEKVLISRSKAGCHVVLMIEEAHDLTVKVLKLLKRFFEIEDGYKKALGLVLIGQPELGALFNEADHYDMREVIRRCQVAEIRGLNGNIAGYLDFKFNRVKVDRKKIVDDKAIEALQGRLTDRDHRRRVVSHAYPLTVNNLVIRAMNEAAETGFALVTEEVVNAL